MADVNFHFRCLLVSLLGLYRFSMCSICPMEKIMDRYKNISYLREIPPFSIQGKPVNVQISIFVQSVSSISEVDMEYTIDIYLRQRWLDPRLTFDLCDDYIYLDSSWLENIWLPDTFFITSRSASFHDVTRPNVGLRVHPNGSIFYSQRLSLTLGCLMKLSKFPLDVQTCEFRILSYIHSDREMVLTWHTGYYPVQADPEIALPQTDVQSTEHGNCNVSYENRNYSCIFARFKFERLNGFYVIQIYVPGVLVVMLSWVSFWLDPRATPARVSLGLLCVLTTTTHTTGINSSLPRVSYIKAMDVWNFTCLLFVFGALLEFAVINVKTRLEEGKSFAQGKRNAKKSVTGESVPQRNLKAPEVPKNFIQIKCMAPWTAERVDKTCRIAFPVAFLIFNICYWPCYKYL